uniref:Uncharacterized protein n=1 Tax=Anguilla anguilla TaxID=7936 RepID=A0A0E9SZ74_ANGAN
MATSKLMRAIRVSEFGGPSVLKIACRYSCSKLRPETGIN